MIRTRYEGETLDVIARRDLLGAAAPKFTALKQFVSTQAQLDDAADPGVSIQRSIRWAAPIEAA